MTKSQRNELICAWVGSPLCILLLFVGWWVCARFLPPLSPAANADEIAAVFQHNTTAIRFGMMLVTIAGALNLLFTATISGQLKRIKGVASALVYAQLAGGTCITLMFILPAQLWSIAAFRLDRDPGLIQLFNDLAWFLIVMPSALLIVQCLAIGMAILADESTNPLFPRWGAFVNFMLALSAAPGALITFFKSGPFAWNGLISFWIGFASFLMWYLVMFVLVARAIPRPDDGR